MKCVVMVKVEVEVVIAVLYCDMCLYVLMSSILALYDIAGLANK